MAIQATVQELYNKILAVENVAKKYPGVNGSVYRTNELTYQFIRRNIYKGVKWIATAGSVPQAFVDMVSKEAPTAASFFAVAIDYRDNSSLVGDFTHLAATIDGYYSSTAPKHWSGWAGDLATLGSDLRVATNNSSDFDVLVNKAKAIIGSSSYTFSSADVYSDVDSLNLYNMISSSNMLFSAAFKNYFIDTTKYKSRFNTFVNSFGGADAFWSYVPTHMNKYYGAIFDIVAYGSGKPSPTQLQRDIICTTFTDYILKHC